MVLSPSTMVPCSLKEAVPGFSLPRGRHRVDDWHKQGSPQDPVQSEDGGLQSRSHRLAVRKHPSGYGLGNLAGVGYRSERSGERLRKPREEVTDHWGGLGSLELCSKACVSLKGAF